MRRKMIHKWKQHPNVNKGISVPLDFAMVCAKGNADYIHFDNGTIVKVEGKVGASGDVLCRKINTEEKQFIKIEDLVRC